MNAASERIAETPQATVERVLAGATRRETPCGAGAMVWRSWGAGPPVVLLHGGDGSWRHWIRTIPALATRYRVHAPDTPGLGDSAMPPEPYTLESIAAIIARGLDEVIPPPSPIDLVGFSFGGILAGHLAALHGERIASATLVGPGGLGLRRGPVTLEKMRPEMTPEERASIQRANLAQLMIADPARIDALAIHLQTENVRRGRVRSRPFALTDALARVLERTTCRINGIWGEHDQVAAGQVGAREAVLRRVRPDIDFRVIEGAGHWVAYEAPEAFNATLLELLARSPARRADAARR